MPLAERNTKGVANDRPRARRVRNSDSRVGAENIPPPSFGQSFCHSDFGMLQEDDPMSNSITSKQNHFASTQVPRNHGQDTSASPIKGMNYFDGISAIRGEQEAFYRQLLEQESGKKAMTNQLVQRTRQQLASEIQDRHFASTYNPMRSNSRNQPSKRGFKSCQHDEFAVMNYYNKVSKYDLDRANLCMRDMWREKQSRRVDNARAKRQKLNKDNAV